MRTHKTQTAARSHPQKSQPHKAVSSSTVHTCSAHRRSTSPAAAPMHISHSVSLPLSAQIFNCLP